MKLGLNQTRDLGTGCWLRLTLEATVPDDTHNSVSTKSEPLDHGAQLRSSKYSSRPVA